MPAPTFKYHECELLCLGDVTRSLGCAPSYLTRLINKGRFPPPIQVEGKDPFSRSTIPKYEVRWITAMISAGRNWAEIEENVQYLVRARKRISHMKPEVLDFPDEGVTA